MHSPYSVFLCILLHWASQSPEVSLLLPDVSHRGWPCNRFFCCYQAVWVEEGGLHWTRWKLVYSGELMWWCILIRIFCSKIILALAYVAKMSCMCSLFFVTESATHTMKVFFSFRWRTFFECFIQLTLSLTVLFFVPMAMHSRDLLAGNVFPGKIVPFQKHWKSSCGPVVWQRWKQPDQ